MEKNSEFDLKKVKVYRTLEGTIFEVSAAVITLVAWILAVAMHHLPTTGDWLGMAGFTLAIITMLARAYLPSNNHVFLIELQNLRQVALSVRMCRIMAIGLAVMALGLGVIGANSPLMKVFAIGLVLIIGIIGFVFIYLIQKAE